MRGASFVTVGTACLVFVFGVACLSVDFAGFLSVGAAYSMTAVDGARLMVAVVAAVYWVAVVGTVNSRTVGVGSENWVAVVGAACWGTSSIVVG